MKDENRMASSFGSAMIHFRTFRNDDPPALVRIWNQIFVERGAAVLPNVSTLESFVLAKPYFDPAGLFVAEEQNTLVGFALAGFGPTADQRGLDPETGVIDVLGVCPTQRGEGIGSGLLAHCEQYLRDRGVKAILAGPLAPRNPFTFGLYGGSESPGWLSEDGAPLGAFMERNGYETAEECLVFQRHLERPFNVLDGRFPALRRRFEVKPLSRRLTGRTWYQACVRGPVEVQEFRMEEKDNHKKVGHALVWEMEPYTLRWNEHAIGVLDIHIEETYRRQGLARLLMGQVLRYYHDQYYTLTEAQTRSGNNAAVGLLTGLGFRHIDTGRQYVKRQ